MSNEEALVKLQQITAALNNFGYLYGKNYDNLTQEQNTELRVAYWFANDALIMGCATEKFVNRFQSIANLFSAKCTITGMP